MRAAAAAALVAVAPAGGDAQEGVTSLRPLAADHWAYELMEALEATGAPGVWSVWAQPLPGEVVREALVAAVEGAPRPPTLPSEGESGVALRAAEWLERELPREGRPGLLSLGVGFEETEVSLRPERGFGAEALGEVVLRPWIGGWVSAEGVEHGGASVRSGGVALRLGSAQVLLGRIPLRSGQGTSRILLDGSARLDGLLVGTRRPVDLPGPLAFLGPTTAHLFVAPGLSGDLVERAWFGAMALAVSPHPRVRLGAFRTTRFAGEGMPPTTAGNLFRVVMGLGGDSDYDDGQGELAARVRWPLGGAELTTYLSLGVEDLPSLWEDPGVVGGILLPLRAGRSLLAGRYQYTAFGKRARWCGSCTYRNHDWYAHPRWGRYADDDIPLGSPLGGYGSRHEVALGLWSGSAPLRVSVTGFHEHREEGNLLYDRWPGDRTGVSLVAAARPVGALEVAADLTVTSTQDDTATGLAVWVRMLDVLPR